MFKKSVLGIMLCLVVLLATAKPTYAAGNFFQNFTNGITSSIGNAVQRFYLRYVPGDKPGATVLAQALVATQNLKTAEVATDVTADLSHATQKQATVHLNMKGPIQLQADSSTDQAHQDFQVVGELSMQGTTLKTAADVKVAGDTLYFKLNEVPTLPNVDLSSITGKWYKTANASATASASLSEEKKSELMAAFAHLWQSSSAGTAHQDTKNGKAVFVTTVTIPRAALEEYLSTLVELQSQNKPDQSADITRALQETLRQNVEKIGDVYAVVWIDKSSFNVMHLESNVTYLLDKSSTISAKGGPLAALSQIDQVALALQLDFDHFNQPIKFEEPTDAKDAADVFSSAFGKVLNSGTGSSVGTSELPTLTPLQRQQLQQLNSISPAQRQNFLDQLSKKTLSTQSGTTH